jgi:hypothetical protein
VTASQAFTLFISSFKAFTAISHTVRVALYTPIGFFLVFSFECLSTVFEVQGSPVSHVKKMLRPVLPAINQDFSINYSVRNGRIFILCPASSTALPSNHIRKNQQ